MCGLSQVLGLVQEVLLLYPSSLRTLLHGYTQPLSARAWVSLDCSLPNYKDVSKATITTLLTVLQPAYVAVAFWFFWLFASLHNYYRGRCVKFVTEKVCNIVVLEIL